MFVSFDCPPEPFWFLYLCCSKRLEILVIRPLCQLLLLNTVSCVPKVAFQNLKLLLVININVPVVYRFQKCIMTSLKADDASGLRWALTIQETHLCVGFSFYFFYFILFHLKKKNNNKQIKIIKNLTGKIKGRSRIRVLQVISTFFKQSIWKIARR